MVKALTKRLIGTLPALCIGALCMLWLSACGVDQPGTNHVSQLSTTCVSDPIVAGHDEEFVPRCEHYYTVDQAQADIVYRGNAIAGYTIYHLYYTLSCFEYDEGYECNLQVPAINLSLVCDYFDDGVVICISPR